jgi:hypothetical protein
MWACKNGSADIVAMLLAAKFDVTVKDKVSGGISRSYKLSNRKPKKATPHCVHSFLCVYLYIE